MAAVAAAGGDVRKCIKDGAAGACADDFVTAATVDAAWSQLASGATHVALSPAGCVAYERSIAGGLVVSEKLTYGGKVALTHARTASTTTGQGDFDLDGYFEWGYALTRGASSAADQAQITVSSPSTHEIVEQKTYTWKSPDVVHVAIARPDANGQVRSTRELDTPRLQERRLPRVIAAYDGAGWFDTGTINLRVNPTKFTGLSGAEQIRTLLHEMLHELAEHDPEILKAPRVEEIDPTEACAQTCWPTSLTTKCSCATCLHTNVDDPRCAEFKPCKPQMGAICPCPTNGKYYETCADCLAGCPSGLICAFYSTCNPIDVSSAPATCPGGGSAANAEVCCSGSGPGATPAKRHAVGFLQPRESVQDRILRPQGFRDRREQVAQIVHPSSRSAHATEHA